MEPLVILLHGKPCGELFVQERGLYRDYNAVCRIGSDAGPMRLFAVGERGELRLGVLQPEDGYFVLHRRISANEACSAGKLLRGELRPLAMQEDRWQPITEPEKLFRDAMLLRRLRGQKGALFCCGGERCFVALPFDINAPFPLPEMFCLAHVRRIGQRLYAMFCFDSEENPRFF